jgi:hypothetical protein
VSLIRFVSDQRPHRGRVTVFVNPDEVSSLSDAIEERSDNKTIITMKTGEQYRVEGYPDDVAKQIDAVTP